MKVLVDTNVWLDVLMNRMPFVTVSQASLAACINDEVSICIAPTSLKDIFYILRKRLGATQAYEAIEAVMEIAETLVVDELICKKALPLERPDYEDGIIAAIALTESIDCIISRDQDAFHQLDVTKRTPAEFLEAQGYEEIGL